VTDGKEPALLTAIRSGYVQPLPSLRAVGKRSNQGAVYQSKWRQDGDVMAETLMDSKQAAKYQNFEGIHTHELV